MIECSAAGRHQLVTVCDGDLAVRKRRRRYREFRTIIQDGIEERRGLPVCHRNGVGLAVFSLVIVILGVVVEPERIGVEMDLHLTRGGDGGHLADGVVAVLVRKRRSIADPFGGIVGDDVDAGDAVAVDVGHLPLDECPPARERDVDAARHRPGGDGHSTRGREGCGGRMPLGEPVPLLAGPGEDLIGARRQAGDGVRSGTGLSERCPYRPGIIAGRVVRDHVHNADIVEDLPRDIPGQRKHRIDPRSYLPFLDLDRQSGGDKRRSRIIQRDEAGSRDRPSVEKDLPGTGRNARVGVVSLRIRLDRPEGDARRIDDRHAEAADGISGTVRHTAGDGPPSSSLRTSHRRPPAPLFQEKPRQGRPRRTGSGHRTIR